MRVYTILLQILSMSLTAGIVTVLVLLVRIPLKKAPKIFSYALWAVVLFRLVCPVSFSSEASLLGAFRAPAATNGGIAYIASDFVLAGAPQADLPVPDAGKIIHDNLPQGGEQTAVTPLKPYVAAAAAPWLGGIAAMLIYSAVSMLLLRRRLVGAVCLRENIYLADHIATPFAIGLIRPKIYLPSSLAEQEQSYIILHEQIHIRRLDHVVKMIAFLTLAVHWFNPLVWAAFVCCIKDMEMSCDERVIKEMGGGIKEAYSTSLLSLATGRRLINGSPLAFGEGNLKGRIRNVMSFKKPEFWVLIATTAIVIAVATCLLANPPKTKTPETPASTSPALTSPASASSVMAYSLAPTTKPDFEGGTVATGLEPAATDLEPASPAISPEQEVGADMAELDYASDNIVIFHGYFGLFVYDLGSKKIVRGLDLKPIGCTATQGDSYCEVTVAPNGNTVQLHPMNSKDMYVYKVSDNTLRKTAYKKMENRFADFVDITGIIDLQVAGSYSHTAVKFGTGEYGYLHTSDWTVGTLAYVQGDDMLYRLFDSGGHSSSAAAEPWKPVSRSFAEALFKGNTEVMKSYLLDPDKVFDDYNLSNSFSDVESITLKYNLDDIKSDSVSVQYEFSFDGEDSNTYLQLKMKKIDDVWKIEWYGLEK